LPAGGPTRVLVVLDRPVLVELISLTLNHGVCSVRTATAVDQVASLATEWQPHLLILDMALNGSLIMQQVRARAAAGASVLVLGLLSGTDLGGKLAAFDAGVDDILSVPFAPEELLARVIALMRHSRTAPIVLTPTITVGQLQIDILNRTVRVGDAELPLSPLELALLYLLAANPGRVLTREEILTTLWGTDYTAQTKLVDQYIRNLRARLQTDSRLPRFIATVPGRGYRFLPSGQTD
jgi:DNA-binding response OmpR family regulator